MNLNHDPEKNPYDKDFFSDLYNDDEDIDYDKVKISTENKIFDINCQILSKRLGYEIYRSLVRAAEIVAMKAIIIIIIVTSINYIIDNYNKKDDIPVIAEIYVDGFTGCEYIVGSLTGITPRLDNQGNHICNPQVLR